MVTAFSQNVRSNDRKLRQARAMILAEVQTLLDENCPGVIKVLFQSRDDLPFPLSEEDISKIVNDEKRRRDDLVREECEKPAREAEEARLRQQRKDEAALAARGEQTRENNCKLREMHTERVRRGEASEDDDDGTSFE